MTRVRGLHDTYDITDDVIAKGGIGSIHVTSRADVVYKQYSSPARAPSRDHLEPLVDIGREVIVNQHLTIGSKPESSINWPLDVIPDRGRGVRGVILPALPATLFSGFGKPRGLEFLIMARTNPPSAKVRVVLLLRMAEILAFIDSRKLVHGDVSGKNLVWSGPPTPMMCLIDCDGMVPQSPTPANGVQALGWTDPRLVDGLIRAHDHHSDWYALALAMYRGLLLVPGNLKKKSDGTGWTPPSQIPDQLDPGITALLRRALDDPLRVDRRPSPTEWVRGLLAAYVPNQAYNETALDQLDRLNAPARSTFLQAPPGAPVPVGAGPGHRVRTPPPPPQAGPKRFGRRNPPPPPPLAFVPAAPSYPPPPPAYPPAPRYAAPPPPVRYQAFPPPPPTAHAGHQPSYPPPPPPGLVAPLMRQPGRLARAAMNSTMSWHLTGLALSCILWPVGLIVLGITLLQLLRVPRGYRGRARAITITSIYLLFCAIWLLYIVVSIVTASFSGSVTPTTS